MLFEQNSTSCVHSARLGSKQKIAFASPHKRIIDVRVGAEERINLVSTLDSWEFLRLIHGCVIGALIDPLFGNRQDLLVVPLDGSLDSFIALYRPEIIRADED